MRQQKEIIVIEGNVRLIVEKGRLLQGPIFRSYQNVNIWKKNYDVLRYNNCLNKVNNNIRLCVENLLQTPLRYILGPWNFTVI